MQRPPCRLALAAILACAGCGDNTNQCGEGTEDIDGVCRPASTTVCGDGTKLESGQCVIDPATCQAQTVLIAGHCVDRSKGLVVDLEESLEPNGLAIATGVEASGAPAGSISLGAIGASFVVHGHVTPFRDADGDGQLDPDVDTYQLTVGAPTLLEITVDGVGGAQGAFYLVGARDGVVPAYERYGLNVTGDTTKRRLFLPAPGLYLVGFTDTRSLAIGKNPPPPAGADAAAGGPAAEYYAGITALAIPAPSVIAGTSQTGTLAADQVALFTATLGPGTNHVRAVMPGAATASIAVLNNELFKGYADEKVQPPAQAQIVVSGIKATDAPLIVVDAAYNYGPAPEPFTVTVTQP